jgi:hypothetical protein
VLNQKGMKDHKNTEAELLFEVQQKGVAVEDAHNLCRDAFRTVSTLCTLTNWTDG